jgi:hypothetical protein
MTEPIKTGTDASACHELKRGEELKTPEEPGAREKRKPYKELRRSPRLECSGLASVQTLPACEMPYPAKIINLSVGGCLMEFERPMALIQDEIVELLFCVNQMPFRVSGQVRVIRSVKLVGFQFPQLNDRVRSQLEELIGELIEHLADLHQESIANRPVQNNLKHPDASAAPPARTATPHCPIRPTEVPLGNAPVYREQHKRWF